ncbi:LOB domain-containing protein 31 [Tripterygium wilfordii]|uniref:LOB domain-containing protein 31 n=2 Tax=Tripterygium wilfordii TaxID=458696 RepID=A0A7J7CFN7_TRIWF|nr:LOB domain-containing protein 31 [Tripterygium wilfordii]
MMSSNSNNGGGPCGACKFLRRKCVKGCIFAPYFDAEQGTAHFAAVHKVFGASNASKLLMRIPAHKRLDAVVTLCYEALARVREPVYGCVGHIFTLQQQLVSLQAELAYIQARLSTFQRLPPPPPPPQPHPSSSHTSLSSEIAAASSSDLTSNIAIMHFDPSLLLHHQLPSTELTAPGVCSTPLTDHQDLEDGDLQALAHQFVSRYLPGVRFKPSTSD